MAAPIVVVHDEPDFLAQASAALASTGYPIITFVDSSSAWDALSAAAEVKLLITRVQFPPGQPHGVALALGARRKHPKLSILFTAKPEYADRAFSVGEFLTLPVDMLDLVAAVDRLLKAAP